MELSGKPLAKCLGARMISHLIADPQHEEEEEEEVEECLREFVPCTRALETEIPLSSMFGFEH